MSAVETRKADLRWLRKAEHWGEWLRFSDTELAPPESVWMMQHTNGRARFYAKGQGQIGPEHAHVMAAICWAFANRYVDPDEIGLSLAARAEVLAGGVRDLPLGRQEKNPTPPASAEPTRGEIPTAPALVGGTCDR